ncbi:MAG: glucose 1-dehydrogenase [Dehalococcoidia bacterium]|nr:glucose 1-dehydrogenase [Dehalococcoidia bacterium]
MKLQDRVAIVTGGGSGIGRAISLELASQGAGIVVADLNLEAANGVAGEISALGRRAVAVKVDVTSSQQVKAMVAQAIQDLGQVDILVNNAGWDKLEPFIQSSEETWDKVIALNLKAPIICARAVLDHMIEKKAGKIVTISSDAGKVGSSGEAVYSGCKAGVVGFSKTLAREMARYGINVNCVCPGPTDTPLLRSLMGSGDAGSKILHAMVNAVPFRRLATPEDIAKMVAFLTSDDAAYVTGQAISVSGGLTMQ